jgi:hypothetical protein
MSDKKYLNSILDSIQDREHVREVEAAGIALSLGGVRGFLAYLGLISNYERIRGLVDKNYRKCSPGVAATKGEKYKKCMLKAKLDGQMKVLQLLNAVGPAKCKTKRDPRKCMEKLKRNRATLQAKIKVTHAKLSLIK